MQKQSREIAYGICCAILILLTLGMPAAQENEVKIDIQWEKTSSVSRTTPILQVVVNPPLRRGSAIHDNAFNALRDLNGDYVRYVPWLPYPKLAVAELEPPKDGRTSWDFSLIDPMMMDFLEATKGHTSVLNFSTIPQWMFKTDKPVSYPPDPNQVVWDYEQGGELRDPTMKDVAGYYARLLSWYTKGGFIDEAGKRHESGHRYFIPFWEVLNEPDLEHNLSPQTGTMINEVGSISSDDTEQFTPGHVAKEIPHSYWNLSGALYAYLFGELTRLGIDVVGCSQLVGYPTQFPSVSMVDWITGKPNARYWVLKLLHDNLRLGDKLVEIEPFSAISPSHPYVYSMAVITKDGRRRVLLVNKRDRLFDVSIRGASGGKLEYVDQGTAFNPPASSSLESDKVTLNGFAVAVVTLPKS